MVDLMPLRRWLRRTPQPAKLRLDGTEISVPKGGNKWQVAADSVVALGGERLEALDATGAVLRVLALGDDDDTSTVAPAPIASHHQQPLSDVVLLARLLAEASDAGARRHAEAYSLAFTKMAGLVETFASRLSLLENAWQKAMTTAARAQADAILAQAQPDEAGDEAGAAIQAMMMAAIAKGGSGGKKE